MSAQYYSLRKEKLDAIVSWLKNQPYYSIERRPCDSSALDPDIVKKIEEIVDKFNVNHSYKEVTMQVKPNLLYKVIYYVCSDCFKIRILEIRNKGRNVIIKIIFIVYRYIYVSYFDCLSLGRVKYR